MSEIRKELDENLKAQRQRDAETDAMAGLPSFPTHEEVNNALAVLAAIGGARVGFKGSRALTKKMGVPQPERFMMDTLGAAAVAPAAAVPFVAANGPGKNKRYRGHGPD